MPMHLRVRNEHNTRSFPLSLRINNPQEEFLFVDSDLRPFSTARDVKRANPDLPYALYERVSSSLYQKVELMFGHFIG